MKCRNIITAIVLSIAVMLTGIRSLNASESDGIKDLILRYQQETKCRSVSAVVFADGEKTYYGDSTGLYQIGSMTKAFTGLAVRKLIDEGLIDEDGAVSDCIPGFEAYFDSERTEITVRELLEQKSGYTNNEKDYPSASEQMTLSEWAESISGRELKSRPGTEYAYSNVNYNLLGLIIENVSGMSYREYMEKEILIPLGLSNTFAGMPSDGSIVEGTRPAYRRVYDYPLPVREASIPAGYFYSNVSDMGTWMEIWTGSKSVPESFMGPLSKVREYLKEEGDYYSGWEKFSDGIVGHSGGTPNYSSRIVFDEKKQSGVCVLSNLNVAASTDSLCNSIFDIVSGKSPAGLVTDIWTIFDRIFTGVTIIGIVLLIAALTVKKKALLVIEDVILISLLVLVFILFPLIFGAGMKAILFTWAPASLAGGLLTIAAAVVAATVKLSGKDNAGHNKTGKGQTADGHNRIS